MIKDKLKLVPHEPGSYQMKNKDGIIIYVGKAKDLNKRVSSYFNREHTGKTKVMVSEIADFSYIVTNTELESFILELNLIKKYDPKYNILLRDDKSYPYIELITSPYPKLKISRYLHIKKRKDKLLFGPYQNATAARSVVNLLNRLYPFKKCDGMPKKVCLYYHIGECLGYCTHQVDKDKLSKMINEVTMFLKGNEKIIKDKLIQTIKLHSENMNYELALDLKKELDNVSIILDRQKTQFRDMINRDIINFYYDYNYVSMEILFIRNGKLLGSHNEIIAVTDAYIDEIEEYIVKYYLKHEIPRELLIPTSLNKDLLENVIKTNVKIPIKGEKKQVLDMCYKNASINFKNNLALINRDEARTTGANEELRKLLKMEILDNIELFDNSSLFGTYRVSGLVVFKNGRPSKKDYRKFKIEGDALSDYYMMKEVIYRRYYRLLMEHKPFPNLIIVDGGIAQINACKEVLESLKLNIKVCGLAKDNHHNTCSLIDGDNLEVIDINTHSEVFLYLARMQEEIHRFTINYHINIRSKGSMASVLDKIPGVGDLRKKALLKKFGSIKKIKEASLSELENVVPKVVALNIHDYLNK